MDARTTFENQLQILGITKKIAASLIGCSPGTVTNYILNGKELKFLTAFKSVDSLFDGDDSFVKKFCVESEKPENLKAAFEYLSTNRYLTELNRLIFKCDSLDMVSDWTDAYRIVYDYQTRSKPYEKIIEDIGEAYSSIKDLNLKALLQVIVANIHHRLYESSSLARFIRSADSKLSRLKDGYFKDSLEMRILELKSQQALFVDSDPETARKYAKKIISSKIGTTFVADGNNLIGTSYLFENKDKAIKYLNKSIKMFRNVNRNDVADAYEYGTKRFVKTYWSEDLTEDNEKIQPAELAYMLARRGEGEKSTEMLDAMEITPFRLYYKGVAKNDPMLHFQALSEFIRREERFYALLPYNELIKTEAYREIAQNILK